jgi:squalene-associated FAD-dependent desaturase
LACACDLADAGLDVVLLEARPRLGGRAYSFRDRETGLLIDNCQHVLLGCCEAAIGFFSRIGSLGLIEFHDSMRFLGDNGALLDIRPSPLPAPLHLLPSLLLSGYLTANDSLALCGVMARLARRQTDKHATAAGYLRSLSCSERLMRRVFEPILVSALNEGLEEASASFARMVLTKTLLGEKGGCRLGVPKAPLEHIVAEPAARYLTARKCDVRLSSKVAAIRMSGKRAESVELASGEQVRFDFCVCATPPWAARKLGVETDAARPDSWRSTVGAHLFFEGEPARFDRVCVVDEPFQWVFNKSRDFGLRESYVHCVASAARGIVGLGVSDLVYLAMRAACRASPDLVGRRLARAVVIRERRATFPTSVVAEAVRPGAVTPVGNMFLAGDWTDTGWPATLEGAVRSGRTAARAIIERC